MPTDTAPPPGFSITDPAFVIQPFAAYDWMTERPVWRDPVTSFWVVTRYEDVRAIATNAAIWSNRTATILNRASAIADQVRELYATQGWLPLDTMISNDPPGHRFYRNLVDKAFTPARVGAVLPFIEARVAQLFEHLPNAEPFDVMKSFAIPLTISVLADQVGGAGPEDFEKIRHWADIQLELINPTTTPERELEITREVIEFQHYVAGAIERVRAAPNEKILSALVRADFDGRALTVQELIAVAQQFFVAGHDTTSAAIGSAARYLAEHPATHALLRGSPEKIPAFVEEILRLEAPVQRLFRRATQDTEIAGVPIRENDVAVIQWGGANRDAARFACPHLLDTERADANRHLSFGAGIHLCIGNQLARAQIRAAVAAITQGCATIALADGENSYEYTPLFISRSPKRMDIKITKS